MCTMFFSILFQHQKINNTLGCGAGGAAIRCAAAAAIIGLGMK